MNILFVNLSALKFTVETPDTAPLGGSESALCYLARFLAAKGHQISLIANLPDGANTGAGGIAHYPVAVLRDPSFFAAQNFSTIIVCNAPAACAPLKAVSPSSRLIFWAHALPDQPAMQILSQSQTRQAIDQAVFVSHWQQGEVEKAFGLFVESSVVGNGIAPAFEHMFASPQELLDAKQNRAAYTTTPYRGLSVLLRAMQGFDRPTQLDIFSSMQVYQSADDPYAALFAQAAQNPAITCHGAVPQKVLAQHLRRSAFLFYPSIYPETFCITAAEAMAAGMKVVSTNLGALGETTQGNAILVNITSTDGEALAQDFRRAMQTAADDFIAAPQEWAQTAFAQSQSITQTMSWRTRANEWEKAAKLTA